MTEKAEEKKVVAKNTAKKQELKFKKEGLLNAGFFNAVDKDILVALLPEEATKKEAEELIKKYKKGEVR